MWRILRLVHAAHALAVLHDAGLQRVEVAHKNRQRGAQLVPGIGDELSHLRLMPPLLVGR
jgi:hypothetical protein